MDGMTQWRAANDRYLAAALQWLRLRLAQLAGDSTSIVAPDVTAQPLNRRFWQLSGAEKPVRSLPVSTGRTASNVTGADVKSAQDAMTAAAAMDPPPALIAVARCFGLSEFEGWVLLLCVAMELDTRIAAMCARAQDDSSRAYPTFALAYALFDDPAWEALSPDRALRYWRLIEINQSGALPLMASALRADEQIVNYVKGFMHTDARLAQLIEPVAERPGPLPPSQQSSADVLAAALATPQIGQQARVFQLVGFDARSKELVAARACELASLELSRMPAQLIPTAPAELETFARLWKRESSLMPQALFVDANESDTITSLERLVGRSGGIFFCAVREARADLAPGCISRSIDRPTPAEQLAAWTFVLGEAAGEWPARLAGQFNLNISEIHEIAAKVSGAQATPGSAADPTPAQQAAAPNGGELWAACLTHTSPRLESLAQRIDPKATLDDVVLPDEERALIRLIAEQVHQRSQVYDGWGFRERMNRGLGISALFTGESGTGKTMAAEAIANELKLNLFRIDLSAVVNKYIGETEKNLRRLFDAAEDGGAILFFDEADALFGKRSEVKDSHDRYANIEINYLLQRLESFGGLAILATNLKSALDTAFTRRLRFVVNFPFPGVKEREAIWRRAFPQREPPLIGTLDYPRLSRFNLTGANIQSIALNAAFLAAAAGEPEISMDRVLMAARTEFKKMDRPVNEMEFKVAV